MANIKKIIFDLTHLEEQDDWLRLGRLQRQAAGGDRRAEAEVERMGTSELVQAPIAAKPKTTIRRTKK